MATQDWLSPNPLADDPITAPPPPPSAGYDLRPLSVGEILDRVFSLYRAHFWFFAGLSAVSAGVSVGIAILRLIFMHFSTVRAGSPAYSVVIAAITIVHSGLYLIAYSLTLAATTAAVNAFYLGEPTSMEVALRTARRLWLRCLGITFWQGWSAGWVFVILLPIAAIAGIRGSGGIGGIGVGVIFFLGVLASLVYGVIAYLRNSLAIPTAVVEDLGVRASMRRSKGLATSRTGRIFLLILLVYALWTVAGLIQVPLAIIMVRSPATGHFVLQAIILAINFIATSLVGPIAAIGLCLFYFDERVRREGFDIELLLRDASISTPSAPAPAVVADPLDGPHPVPGQT